jgi:predicted RNase H-like HicB family nuclease
MKTVLYPIIIETMEEGGYFAQCPILQGCHVEGKTYVEAIENIQDAINLILESYKELGKEIPLLPEYEKEVVISSVFPVQITKPQRKNLIKHAKISRFKI